MKRPASGKNRWADHYTRRAQKEQFPARSVYKLEEIQRRYTIIAAGGRVLDLGCAPGSWLLFAARIVGPGGRVIGIDRTPVTCPLPPTVRAIVGDVTALSPDQAAAVGDGFDVVLSDMAPSTTGRKEVDAARSAELCRAALAVAEARLKAGGHFCCKIFTGEDAKPFADAVKRNFRQVQLFKPKSSRKASKEIYVIGIDKRQPEDTLICFTR